MLKQEQFLQLYEPVHERFERFCRVRAFEEMDYRDLMNDTLLVAYEKLDKLQSEQAFLSFLFGICVRILGNHIQKKKEPRIPEGTAHLKIMDECSKTSSFENEFLYSALAKLNSSQRECIILFEISGFSIQEISEIQNTSISNVKQRLKRGREKLKEVLIQEYTEINFENYG